jgi:toxin ParE1/3/4
MKLRLSGAAREDLLSLWEYIAVHDELAADRYLDHVRERAMELISYPELGRPRPEIISGVRSLLCRNHLIFYRIEKGVVQVLRVLHGSMDLPSQEYSEDE